MQLHKELVLPLNSRFEPTFAISLRIDSPEGLDENEIALDYTLKGLIFETYTLTGVG
jgi:hypothetical protein